VIAVADPANPSEVGRYQTPGDAVAVDVRDHYAYVANSSEGIIVLEFYGETGIGGNDGEIFRPPKSWVLSQNYPNPFNPSTSISFDVPDTRASAQHVSLTVYDIRGRRAKALVDSSLEPGIHKVYWDGRDDQGVQVSSGVYLYVLRAGDETFTRKMIALK